MSVDLFPLFDGGSSRTLAKDETLFLTGAPVRSMFLVTEGQVDLVRHTETGLRVLLYGTAGGPAQVRPVPLALFRARPDGSLVLASAWAARLAHGLQGARMNAAIRSMRTVEERLEAWLAAGSSLPPKGQWQSLAEALGVTREALYRELSKRHSAV